MTSPSVRTIVTLRRTGSWWKREVQIIMMSDFPVKPAVNVIPFPIFQMALLYRKSANR